MRFRKSKERKASPAYIDVVIGPGASFKGELECQSSVRIDGFYEGSIKTPANVIVGESAKVIADITAKTVSVSGAFKGSIFADRVELLDGGRIWGDVTVKSFLLDEGGYIRGQVIMRTPEPVENPFEEGEPPAEEAQP